MTWLGFIIPTAIVLIAALLWRTLPRDAEGNAPDSTIPPSEFPRVSESTGRRMIDEVADMIPARKDKE